MNWLTPHKAPLGFGVGAQSAIRPSDSAGDGADREKSHRGLRTTQRIAVRPTRGESDQYSNATSRRGRALGTDAAEIAHHGEKFNALTHLVAAVLALAGTIVLVAIAAQGGDPWKVVSVSIYGLTLVLLYTMSVLYHGLHGSAKKVLRELDHQSIYLLIAGSYTPFCLVTLRGNWGWSLLGVVWGLAVLGGLQELRPRNEARLLSVVIYVVMGWVAMVAIFPLLQALGPAGFAWLAAGGLCYTFGIVFYALDARVAHAHGVWHLFVIAGSTAHYFAILHYVL